MWGLANHVTITSDLDLPKGVTLQRESRQSFSTSISRPRVVDFAVIGCALTIALRRTGRVPHSIYNEALASRGPYAPCKRIRFSRSCGRTRGAWREACSHWRMSASPPQDGFAVANLANSAARLPPSGELAQSGPTARRPSQASGLTPV